MKACLLCEVLKSELNDEKITCDDCEDWVKGFRACEDYVVEGA